WLRRPGDIAKLAALQAQLLARAADFVKPGGALVYAVCSLEPEEGPAVIAAAPPAWTHAPNAAAVCDPQFLAPDGALRTVPAHWPALGGLDGFYATRLLRAPA
ncbi:MAG: hypothetical protein AB7L65_08240, partial [Hyphomonadaceae bacterium]